MRVLVAAASKHGSTWEIAQTIGDVLTDWDIDVDVEHIEDVYSLAPYDAVILGSAVYGGFWLKPARAFVTEHQTELSQRPVWLFSSGPLGRVTKLPANKAVNIRHITQLIRVQDHHIFAGKLKRSHLDLVEKVISSTLHAPRGDFRDWGDIRAWSTSIAHNLKRGRTPRRLPDPYIRYA